MKPQTKEKEMLEVIYVGHTTLKVSAAGYLVIFTSEF